MAKVVHFQSNYVVVMVFALLVKCQVWALHAPRTQQAPVHLSSTDQKLVARAS